ncbi:hypothetical protein HanXRQr2_Chr11g0513731 [Helianthus annuus]|uniref:Uncharacterized protein n=1 Tax=Helianthus annuus TaxID=4232 RepID=A0A9K3HTE7_HELAN|nr:hypothetical protein HanXRQr2_Chr11g0513731 [Helianthus annuus]KAJ0876988.1 hypothetical protein HanPSC8_Chr11g0494991 [Helianthus annuus]
MKTLLTSAGWGGIRLYISVHVEHDLDFSKLVGLMLRVQAKYQPIIKIKI